MTTTTFAVCEGCGGFLKEEEYSLLTQPDDLREIYNSGERHELEIEAGWLRVSDPSGSTHIEEYFYCPDCQ